MTALIRHLLREARSTGQMIAAVDALLQLGYDLARAKRACQPYAGAVESAYRLLSLADQEAAAQAASDAAIESGLDRDLCPLAWEYLQIAVAWQIADATRDALDLEEALDQQAPEAPDADEDLVRAEATLDLLDAATIRARRRWAASDEVREWAFGGESLPGGREPGHHATPSAVEDELRDWTEGGDWDLSEGTFWVTDHAWPIDPVTSEEREDDRVDVRVTFEPEEPACDDDAHDWQSPHDLLGGLKENPGVWGKGGGVIIREVCAHCGAYRVTDTWAQDPSTGMQGLRSVAYEAADEDSIAWVSRRDDDADDDADEAADADKASQAPRRA